ncbi:MAG: PP2C family protein-serine/threonine phosphatase, partial [Rhizobacter sp.]
MIASTQPRVSVVALSDRGPVRTRNEDAMAVGPWLNCASLPKPVVFSFAAGPRFACLVADGMGGHPCGDIASRTVAAHAATTLLAGSAALPELAASAVHEAHA